MIKPYFDFDSKQKAKPELAPIRQKCLDAVWEIFKEDPEFCIERNVLVGYRHGWLATGEFKVSFRLWVSGYAIALQDMPGLIKQCSPEGDDTWDMGVYHAQQKMGVPGACKGGTDHRVLELEDRSRAAECVIQHLTGEEKLLNGFDPVIKRTSTDKPPEHWDTIMPMLTDFGFHDPYPTGTRPESITFRSSDIGQQCPCCPNTHDSNSYYVKQKKKWYKTIPRDVNSICWGNHSLDRTSLINCIWLLHMCKKQPTL